MNQTSTAGRPQLISSAIIVQQRKVLDFIDGQTQRDENPEEYVRQEIAKSLVREYGYAKRDITVEFTLRLGSRKPRADIVIFPENAAHDQGTAFVIVECKASLVKSADSKEDVGQLLSYMAACENVRYGIWTNGMERFCYRRVFKNAASLRARADVQERALATASGEIITQFIAGDLGNFTISTPTDAG